MTTPTKVGKMDKARYDIGFLDASDNFIGLVLAKDKNDVPKYREITDPTLASQFFTGSPGYANMPPEKELVISQSDWREGYGQEYYNSNEPKRYYYSKGVDARFKGMAISGPLATGISLPTGIAAEATLTNANMETITSGWTDAVRSDTQKHGGSYSYFVAGGAADGYQNAATFDSSWQSKKFTFGCWVYAAALHASDRPKIGILDKAGSTSWSPVCTTAADWVYLSVTKQLAADADKVQCILHADGTNTTYFDDAYLGSPVIGAITCFEDFDSDLYMGCGQILWRVNHSDGTRTVLHCFEDSITDLEAFVDDNLYIALGGTKKYFYMDTSDVLIQSELSDGMADFFETVNITLWKAIKPRETKQSTNPTNAGSWTTLTNIDSTAYNITNLVEQAGTIYIGKEDMPYYVDSSGNVQRLIPSLKAETSTRSCKAMLSHKERLYMAVGQQALIEYDAGTVTDLSPASYITNNSDFDGEIMAMAYDAQWLFAFMDDGTNLQLLAGRWEIIEGTTSWVWHPLDEQALAGAETAYASTVFARRLWVSSTSSAQQLFYYPLPSQYGNIAADTSYAFQSGGELVTSWLDGGFFSDKKAFIKLTLNMAGTSSTVYWRAYYEKMGDASATEINSPTYFKTSPSTSAYIPVDGSSVRPQSTHIRFTFKPINTSSTTPKLLSYDCRAIWYPTLRKLISCQVVVADDQILKDGRKDEDQTATTIRTAIAAFINPTTAWPRAFYPPYYKTSSDLIYCKLLPPTEYHAIKDEKGREIEWVYDLLLEIVEGIS